MELNEYNGLEDHCKITDIEDLKRKFLQKESHSIDTMEQMMQRKDQEFIDHSLLAPEYMRDPNHFIMDLMNFPKGVNTSHNNTDNLPTDLHFHNSLFPVSAEDHQHSNDERKTPPSSVFMPLNNDFLMPVTKSYSNNVEPVTTVEDNNVKVVQQLLLNDTNVTLDDASIDDDCDLSRFSSRKVLPHKKRISRKLKINHCDNDLQLDVPLENHKLPNVEQLVGGSISSIQQFRCELCGHATCSQLEFFAHLKQHYEPSTPDTILAAMKTSLEALGPEKTEEASDLCVINKKTDGLDQVFQHVNFPFENFTQNEDVDAVRVIMEQQHHHVDAEDIKMVNNQLDEAMNASTSALQLQNQPQQQQMQQQQQQHQQQQQQQPQTTPNLVPEEFSDTEDMLEGIRDKVLIEDTCDTMDLMTPTSNGVRPHWFTNTCFNSIDLKTKPFCDVLFSGQFAPILNNDTTAPIMNQGIHITDTKLLEKEMEHTPTHLQPPPLQPLSLGPPQPPPPQHPTDLRTHYSHTEPSLNHEPPQPVAALNDHQLIQSQNIKIEDTPPRINDIPPQYQNSEDTLSGNEEEQQQYHHQDNQDDYTDNEEYNCQLELERESEIYNYQKTGTKTDREEYDESVYEENGDAEDDCSENGETTDNGKRKKYICNKCQRVFNSCNALKYHHRTHSGLRPHQCDICSKSFFAIGALKAHIRTHTGDKPFECDHCDRKFRQWGDLKYHTISIHSTEKNHQCEFCGKAFARKYSLVVHLRIHTSERNYKCEFCTKTFRASTYLQNHRKIHTGEKPYECDVCLKKFRVSGDLRRHQRIHERKRLKQDLLENANNTTPEAKSAAAVCL